MEDRVWSASQEVLRREEEGASAKPDSAALLEQLERMRGDLSTALSAATAERGDAEGEAAAVGEALERALAPVQASLAALQAQARMRFAACICYVSRTWRRVR